MSRRAISIALAVVCLAVLLGAAGQFAINRETSYMQECVSEGFAIDGYYRDDKTSLETLAFHEEDNHRWQLVDKDGSCVDGQFKRTDDPNIVVLTREYGEKSVRSTWRIYRADAIRGRFTYIRNTKVT